MEPDDRDDADYARLWPSQPDPALQPQPSVARLNAAVMVGVNPEYTGYRGPRLARVRPLPTRAAAVIAVHPERAAMYRANHCPRCNGPLRGGGPKQCRECNVDWDG